MTSRLTNDMPEITIGADPELFITQQGKKPIKYVSAHDVVPGTKGAPYPVDFGAVQYDGVAAEFNIMPSKTAEEFAKNIHAVIFNLEDLVATKIPGAILVSNPAAVFDKKYFDSLPDEAKASGCSPDYDAYTEDIRPSPQFPDAVRFGGGHIHLGWTKGADTNDEGHMKWCRDVVKQLDVTLGLQSYLWDKTVTRRHLFPLGIFRPCHFGVEYRVLSNAWTKDYGLTERVGRVALDSVRYLFSGTRLWEQEEYATAIRYSRDGKMKPVHSRGVSSMLSNYGLDIPA